MKKILLFVLALGVGYAITAQTAYKFKMEPSYHVKGDKPAIGIEPIKEASLVVSQPISKKITPPADREVNIVTVIDIGSSANAWSYGSNNTGNQRSMVWVDPELNIVTNFHRMGGELDPGGFSGDYGYDISFDGGITWTNNIECYVAVNNNGGSDGDASRYPNHGIYNPTGNVADARVSFFGPNLEGSNSDTPGAGWGGYTFGTANISDPADTTGNYNTSVSGDGIYQYIPDAFDVNSKQNMSIAVDNNVNWTSGTGVYEGGLTVTQGYYNEDTKDFIYEQWIAELPGDGPYFQAVAFSPDGMTGYIVALANNGETWAVEGMPNIYPIFWKTTDGGENWDGPTAIQIDGPDGIGGIVNYALTDEQIAGLYEEPLPARDEIPYTYLGDFDIAVTADGNLHIAGIVAPAGEAETGIAFFVENGMGAQLDMFSTDGGETFQVEEMGRIIRYSGAFGDMNEANRTQITMNPGANKVFVSWLDTDLEDEEENTRPNIWCRGFSPSDYMKTANASGEDAATNVTNFSAGMWQSYLGTAPKTCFEHVSGEYTIPFVYVGMDPTDPGLPVRYKYIQDFKFTPADWTVTAVQENFEETVKNISVSQNYPNPFNGNSNVSINLSEGADLSLEVYSITGQLVASQDYGYKSAGTTTVTISGQNLTPGVYFYTVRAGESTATRKMIVE